MKVDGLLNEPGITTLVSRSVSHLSSHVPLHSAVYIYRLSHITIPFLLNLCESENKVRHRAALIL